MEIQEWPCYSLTSMKPLSFFAGLCVMLASACTSIPTGRNTATQTLPFLAGMKVERTVLSNGLTLLILEDHSSPTFAFQTWFHVGSKNEVPQYTGLAHFFEHMMFKRTKNHPDGEFDDLLERAGTEGTNAFTTMDVTAYVHELPKSQLDLILSLESDRMVNLIVDDEAFKTEREVIHNERRMRMENNPDGLMFRELMSLSFSQHPYHWPTIGYPEDLDRMTAKDGYEFYKKFYTPDRATIVIVGDIDASRGRDLVEKYYGAIQRGHEDLTHRAVEPIPTSPRRSTLKLNVQVQKLLMSYPIPSALHEDAPALEVVEYLLARGRANRLDLALVNTGIAANSGCNSETLEDSGIFALSATLQQGKSSAMAEQVILRELDRLKSVKIGPAELNRAKNLVRFAVLQGMGENHSRASMLGRAQTILGDFRKSVEALEKIQQVTAEDIQRVAKTYFANERRTVVTGAPK